MKKHYFLPLTTLALTLLPGAVFAHTSTVSHSHGNEFLATAAVVAIAIVAGIAIKKR